jgi:hypothetical protein
MVKHRAAVARPLALATATAGWLASAACATEPPCPPATLAPLDGDPAYAVVTSDYQATAIALLDADGALVTEAWIDSGATEPGIVAALSGDVSLPTEPWPGELVLLDRYGVDVVTRIAIPSGEILGQIPTRLPRGASPTGFLPNPHDAIRLDERRALVTRFDPNPNPAAPELDRGNDLVVVDLERAELVERIDLSHLDQPDARGTIWARPDRMIRRAGLVVVGLARLGAIYWQAGDGAIAIVDPEARTATDVPLDGLRNCGAVRAVADDAARVLVLCAGDSFEPDSLVPSSEATRRAHAGLALVHVASDGAARVELTWRAVDSPDRPIPTTSLVSLGGTRAVFTATGEDRSDRPFRPDRVFTVDLAGGEPVPLFESGAVDVAVGHFAPATGLLFLPDASAGIRRVWVGDVPEEATSVDPSPCRRLPAREVAPLARGPST